MSLGRLPGMFTFAACLLNLLHYVSAQDPIQGQLRLGRPCFDTVLPSGCSRTLAQSFTPQSPSVTNNEPRTLAFLFTPASPDAAELLHECGGGLPPGSTYDRNADTEVFIHGWLDGVCRSAWMRECKEQLFLRAKSRNTAYNVILVDWTWGNTPDYLLAGLNARIVGEQVGFIINNIMRQAGVGPEKFHVVGHSFGAIASGFAGRGVRGLRRITALDPAYSPFGTAPPNQRITYRDARIVDVIHSNGLSCFAISLGDKRQLGHADFYPNGGALQAGCYYYIFEALLKGDVNIALISLEPRFCPHLHAIQWYKLSINPSGCEYVGVEAPSYGQFLNQSSQSSGTDWAVMGMDYELYHRNDGRRRNYFLKTTDVCPYYDSSYLGRQQFPFRTSCTA